MKQLEDSLNEAENKSAKDTQPKEKLHIEAVHYC